MTSWYPPGVERQRGQYRYTVKETADGKPWIVGEPVGDTAPTIFIDDLEIGFTLRPGATLDDAHWVAKSMNDWIVDTVLY
jgi:hypothetical protein